MDKLVSISQAADMLGVSQKIMRIWDDAGKVEAVRTAGGHRRYRRSEIEKLQGIKPEEAVKVEEKICLYARVSSHEQKAKGDLDRQKTRITEYAVKKGISLHTSPQKFSKRNQKSRPWSSFSPPARC